MYKLYSATIELTRKCNARCKHCIVDALYPKDDELSQERIIKLIEELHDEGCQDIILTGGEPFLRQEWPLYIQKIKSLNMSPVIMSNGLLINDSIIKTLRNFDVTLGLSLDGPDSETHDSIRGVKGIFNHFVEIVPKLIKAGVYVAVPTTVMRSNFDKLDNILKLLLKLRVETWQLQIVKPCDRLNQEEVLTEEEYYKLAEKIVYYRKKYLRRINITESDCIGYNSKLSDKLYIQNWRGCECGIYSVSIESDGNVKGCPNMNTSEGNVKEKTFKEIWQNHESFKYNRFPNIDVLQGFCKECEHKYVCRGGCPMNPKSPKTGSAYCLHKIETVGAD